MKSMKRAREWVSRRWSLLVCVVIIAILLGSMSLQIVDQGAGKKVITLGHIAYAAGSVDYSYDGVDDDVQFQAALDALPATGGRLVNVSAVQLNFSAIVTRAIDNVSIDGSGRGSYFTNDGVTDLFTAGGDNWVFSNIRTDAGDIGMGATTGWMWTNVTIDATYYAYRSPYGQSIMNDVTVASLTDSGLTSGRVPIAGVGGLLSDDIDLTFSGDTLTVTNITAPVGRVATFVVAASDADAQSIAQADYVCDGTADDVEIQAAIDALPAGGGRIHLTQGTFTIASTININRGLPTWLSGEGRSTVLATAAAVGDIIYFEPNDPTPTWGIPPFTNDRLEISNLAIKITSGADVNGIHIYYHHNVSIHDNWFEGDNLIGINGTFINNSHFINNFFGKTKCGIFLDTDIDDCIVSGNDVSYATDIGMYFNAGTKILISNNAIEEAGNYGMYFGNVGRSTISNNNVTETYSGPNMFFDTDCENNIISGNHISDAGSHVADTYAGILIAGDDNLVTHNYLGREYGAFQKYGVELQGSAYRNKITNNWFGEYGLRNTTGPILDGGVSTVIRDNIEAVSDDEIRDTIGTLLYIMSDPEALWPMKELTGTVVADFGRLGHDLTASHDMATWDQDVLYLDRVVAHRMNGTDEEWHINDDADFSFGNGGADVAFSIIGIIRPSFNGFPQTIIGKYNENTPSREWILRLDAFKYLEFELYDESVDQYIGREFQTAVTEDEAIIVIISYNGGSISAGVNIFVDGIEVDDADHEDIGGAGYTAMEDLAASVKLGTNIGAGGANDNFYKGTMAWFGVCRYEISRNQAWAMSQLLENLLSSF